VVPAATNVLSGTTFDNGTAGTATLPPANRVRAGLAYGAGGTSLLGTVVEASPSDVRFGVQYGAGGTEFTGTYAGGGSYPTADEIAAAVVGRPEFIDIWAEAAGDATGLDAASKTFMIPGTNTPRLNASMSGGGRAVSRA
jgi:hypothetical protein